MILTDIEEKLRELDDNVFYGMVYGIGNETVWNYIVFNRTSVKHSANNTSASDYFDVHIIRENYVPDGMDAEVIKKLTALHGVRVAGDATFDYTAKPSTDTVVEMLTIPFVRARK